MSVPDKLPISVFIIARDEASRIGLSIDSVRDLVAEVVVVEWGSVDGTAEIAARCGARVLHNEWKGYGPQKRFAETCCSNRWLLNLDADEALSPELARELRSLFAGGNPACDAYRLVIRAMCPHEDRPQRWAYANSPIRLYDRDRGGFADSLVHDSVLMREGSRVGTLRGDVHHRGILTFEQLAAKINSYTSMQAADWLQRKQPRVSWLRMLTAFPAAFLKSYFLRRHFVWGRYGFAISVCYAFARLLRLAKVHEQQLLSDAAQRGSRKPPAAGSRARAA